jgi:carbonic anhydrase/acetyltransferase-like protein (isoleucine patch superfamily)
MPIYEHCGVRPTLGKDVYIAPSGTVIGDVVLGDEASIWFGAVVRGDCYPIRIGARSNVQDGCVIHVTGGQAETTIGDDVTIGHLALLHGCTVGNRVLVGMGSIVLDKAVVGDECIIAAGALVPPGMRIPPRSMVMGHPAKVVRSLKERELAWIREAAVRYLEYSHLFRTRVVQIAPTA